MSIVVASLGACTDETVFTDEEREILAEYKLPANPPPNPSNRVADDPRAAVLGKKFFFDGRFSGKLGPLNDGVTNGSLGPAGAEGKVSCFGCHQLEVGGHDRRSRPGTVSLGVNYGLRNSPTVINAAYSDIAANGGWQLWDGRKDSLWAQALGPMEGANEHNGTRLQYAHIIFTKYRAEYEAVFGPMPDLTDEVRFPPAGKPMQPAWDMMAAEDKVLINRIYSNIGKAIEAYERKLISPNFEPSPFDRMLAGENDAMSPAAVRGARLFIGKAACNECHRGPTFTDYRFHNIGCPQEGQYVMTVDVGRSRGIPTVKADAFNRNSMYSDAQTDEHLRELVEANPDIGAFKTPGLRNVGKSAPYMHNGVYSDLWDVVNHYNFGGGTGAYSGTKEITISPLLLTADEQEDLVEFLRSLDDGLPLPTEQFPEGLLTAPTLPM